MNKLAGFLMCLASAATAHAADPAADAGKRSAAQAAAVVYWSAGYTGAELTDGNFGCPAPALPAVAIGRPPSRDVRHAIAGWERCHERSLADLDATPAESRIPAGVLAAMTPAERVRARAHVSAVQARVAEAARANGAAIMARHATWRGATVEYVAHGYVQPAKRPSSPRD